MKSLQFIWWREWQGFHFAKATRGLALIYDYYLYLGFLEIRKWHVLEDEDIARYMRQEVS